LQEALDCERYAVIRRLAATIMQGDRAGGRLPFPWMPGTMPGMTIKLIPNHVNESEH
jgi:hypothetical protein